MDVLMEHEQQRSNKGPGFLYCKVAVESNCF